MLYVRLGGYSDERQTTKWEELYPRRKDNFIANTIKSDNLSLESYVILN